MPNPHRGEVEATLNGTNYTLCLTLGALAELEEAIGAENITALLERFESGQIKSQDLTHILTAGLKGGGYDITFEEVTTMKTENGAAGYINIATRLLKATFDAE